MNDRWMRKYFATHAGNGSSMINLMKQKKSCTVGVILSLVFLLVFLAINSYAFITTTMIGGNAEAAGCTTANDEAPLNDGTNAWTNTAGGNVKWDVDDDSWLAQSIVVLGSGTVTFTQAIFSCAWFTSTNDTVHVEIHGNNVSGGFGGGDCPDNSAISNSTSPSVEPDVEALAGDCDECTTLTFTFATPPTGSKTPTKYWFVLKGDQADALHCHIEEVDGFGASDFAITNNSGTTWDEENTWDATWQANGCD